MKDSKKEKYINNISPNPVSFKGTENILNQMNNCVCRIYNNGNELDFSLKFLLKIYYYLY